MKDDLFVLGLVFVFGYILGQVGTFDYLKGGSDE